MTNKPGNEEFEKMLEEKNKELIKHTVNESINLFFQEKGKEGGFARGSGGGVSKDSSYIKDMQILNKKLRAIEDHIKTLTTKMENYENPLSPEDLEEEGGVSGKDGKEGKEGKDGKTSHSTGKGDAGVSDEQYKKILVRKIF